MAETIHFELVSPNRLVLSEAVEMVVVPGVEGDFGAMARHEPMLSTVRPGTVTLYNKGKPGRQLFVAGGFAEVTGERCTVLSEEAFDLGDVGADEVVARLQDADDRLKEASDEGEKAAAQQRKKIAEALKAAFEAKGGHLAPRPS